MFIWTFLRLLLIKCITKQTHCLRLSLCALCKRRDSPWRGSHACARDGNVRNKTHPIAHLRTSDSHVSHCEYYTDDIHVLYREDRGVTLPPPSPLRARPVSSDPHRKSRRSEADRPTRPATWFLLLVQTVDQDPARLGSARFCSALLPDLQLPADVCEVNWSWGQMMCGDVTSGSLATSNISATWERRRRGEAADWLSARSPSAFS